MRSPQESVIDGHHYRITPLMATAGIDLVVDVMHVVGPAVGIVLDGLGLDKIDKLDGVLEQFGGTKLGDKFLESAVRALLGGLTKEKARHIVKVCSGATRVRISKDGNLTDWMPLQGDTFELHFQGELAGLAKWLMFALKVLVIPFVSASSNGAPFDGETPNSAADS